MMGGIGGSGNYGMMGEGYNAQSLGVNLTNGEVTTPDQVVAIAKAYTQKINQNFVVDELHEFTNGYEAEFKDATTGVKAYEMIYKNGGQIITEMGQGYSIRNPELAPGYYEFMVQKDGKDYAELDVNGYTGRVWYENWHGPILNTTEVR